MKARILFVALAVLACTPMKAQQDSARTRPDEKIKTGFTFGALPVVAYGTDFGLKYGALANLYWFGDGSTYPFYRYSLYLEWSRTTKGGGINQVFFDSKYLIPGNIRLTADLSLFSDKTLDFYGFNGYEAEYNPAFADPDDPLYRTRVFYRYDRTMSRILTDLQGNLSGNKLRWAAGLGHINTRIASVDIERINKGADPEDILPDTATLYDQYVDWGVIPQDEKDGGAVTYVKGGLVYDTRDNEPNPMRGTWAEGIILTAPSFLGNKDASYTLIGLTLRKYFTLKAPSLSLAARAGYQTKIAGNVPFYMLPYVYSTFRTQRQLGGSKTIRGMRLNRLQGQGFTYGNLELRWKVLRTVVLNQNFYIALSAFTDWGMITLPYEYDVSGVPINTPIVFDDERLHQTLGGGIHLALNDNFIIAIDYGRALNPQDGDTGFYIELDFLY